MPRRKAKTAERPPVQGTGREDDEATILEEMLAEARSAGEPGIGVADVVHAGDAEVPTPMVVSSMESAGYVYLYDTKTGDQSKTNRNMLLQQLNKKRPDGTRFFTLRDPGFRPPQGKFKCLLHPDQPERAAYDEMGMPVCTKGNLTSRFQVQRHMQSKHKSEWMTIEGERLEDDKTEERNFRRGLMEMATK